MYKQLQSNPILNYYVSRKIKGENNMPSDNEKTHKDMPTKQTQTEVKDTKKSIQDMKGQHKSELEKQKGGRTLKKSF